jgi:type VI secretion system protein ImpI
MALHLRIENVPNLPDGGPIEFRVTGKRGIDIGRDAHLDWTLPDPTRHISSKHVEVRYKDGGYWLHDVSTNGTFLNGGDHRMQAPHRLRTGDRFAIGQYIIAVAVDGEGEDAGASPVQAAPPPVNAAYEELWASPEGVAPPIDRAQLRAPRDRAAPVKPDFLDWATDVPDADQFGDPSVRRAAPAPTDAGDMGWAAGPMTPQPPPPPPPPELPTPRRPVWDDGNPAPAPVPPPATEGFPARDQLERAPAPSRRAEFEPPSLSAAAPGDADEFLRRFAAAAGIPADVFAGRNSGELADQLGAAMRLVVENVMQLLNARLQAKRHARSANHTMIQAVDNNPLKFAPSTEDALRVLFGPPTRSYLDAQRAFEQGFQDLKNHQIRTYAAMQHALSALMADLEPQAIERSAEPDRGIAALMTSRKAKLWDTYVARWHGMEMRDGSNPLEVFMRLFAEYYDRNSGTGR